MGHPITDLKNFLYSFQLIYLTPVLNLFVPSFISNVIKSLSFGFPQTQIVGDLIFGGLSNHALLNELMQTSSYTYEKMGFTTKAFILTASDVLTFILFVFIGICLIEIFEIFYKKKSTSKIGIVMQDIFPLFFTKLAFASHLNLTELNIENSQAFISLSLALIFLIICYCWLIYLCIQAKKFYREKQTNKQNPLREALFSDFFTKGSFYPANLAL